MRKDCWMRGDGPLVPFGGVFRAELAEAGHPLGSQKHYLLLMSRLNRWLDAEGLETQNLSVVTAQRFLDATRANGLRHVCQPWCRWFHCLTACGTRASCRPSNRSS